MAAYISLVHGVFALYFANDTQRVEAKGGIFNFG